MLTPQLYDSQPIFLPIMIITFPFKHIKDMKNHQISLPIHKYIEHEMLKEKIFAGIKFIIENVRILSIS